MCGVFFFKQKTAYEIKECDWSSDVCSSDLRPMDVPEVLSVLLEEDGVKPCGLMTIPPFSADPEDSREYFRKLKKLKDDLDARGFPPWSIRELSMGMSGDYEVAIEEGATIVRVGTAVFGRRDY